MAWVIERGRWTIDSVRERGRSEAEQRMSCVMEQSIYQHD